MLRSAYKHFSSLNLVKVTSKNDSKLFKVALVDGNCLFKTLAYIFEFISSQKNKSTFKKTIFHYTFCIMLKRVTSLWNPYLRYCFCAQYSSFQKNAAAVVSGEPLATLCQI